MRSVSSFSVQDRGPRFLAPRTQRLDDSGGVDEDLSDQDRFSSRGPQGFTAALNVIDRHLADSEDGTSPISSLLPTSGRPRARTSRRENRLFAHCCRRRRRRGFLARKLKFFPSEIARGSLAPAARLIIAIH